MILSMMMTTLTTRIILTSFNNKVSQLLNFLLVFIYNLNIKQIVM